MSNITQVVVTGKNTTTLYEGVTVSELPEFLSGTNSFTFFAPSHQAFEKPSPDTVQNLLEPVKTAKVTDI